MASFLTHEILLLDILTWAGYHVKLSMPSPAAVCPHWGEKGESPDSWLTSAPRSPGGTVAFISVSSAQPLSRVRPFATPWTTARQASLSTTNSRSPPKPMSIESVMPSNHLILHCPLLLLPPIPPSTRVFSNESALHIRWPRYWSFSFSISPSNEHLGLNSFRRDWLDLLAV